MKRGQNGRSRGGAGWVPLSGGLWYISAELLLKTNKQNGRLGAVYRETLQKWMESAMYTETHNVVFRGPFESTSRGVENARVECDLCTTGLKRRQRCKDWASRGKYLSLFHNQTEFMSLCVVCVCVVAYCSHTRAVGQCNPRCHFSLCRTKTAQVQSGVWSFSSL